MSDRIDELRRQADAILGELRTLARAGDVTPARQRRTPKTPPQPGRPWSDGDIDRAGRVFVRGERVWVRGPRQRELLQEALLRRNGADAEQLRHDLGFPDPNALQQRLHALRRTLRAYYAGRSVRLEVGTEETTSGSVLRVRWVRQQAKAARKCS